MAELTGRVAIVTGAGRGIGLAIATSLGEQGAHVVIGELDEMRGRDAARQLASSGISADAMYLDVTDGASCKRLVADVVERLGNVDILINNAGIAGYGPTETLDMEEWQRHIAVILTGTLSMAQAVHPAMVSGAHGSIVNIASIGGMGGWPLRAAYNAAKAAVINLTETLATEWASHGIRVNSISPGTIRTAMAEEAETLGVASLERYAKRTPMGRLGEVSEIASAVEFLVSDRASFVTGVNLRVDGGWVAWANLDGEGYPAPRIADDDRA
jgi:NAD(P)-dependent dehydrogenase (short-subunit alcohol dehydrogenase family)